LYACNDTSEEFVPENRIKVIKMLEEFLLKRSKLVKVGIIIEVAS
jgi:hypothetical protein